MSEPTVEPVVEPVAPEPTTPEPTPTTPVTTQPAVVTPPDEPSEPMVEQKRFTGAIQKIQTLTEELKVKDQEAVTLKSQIEQLGNTQAVKAAETQAGYGERDKQLEAALLETKKVETEAAQLRGTMRKIEMAKELGHPELVVIIDTIPTFDDDDLQKKAMEDIIGFSDSQVKAREESLLSGITPAVSPTAPIGDAQPASDDAWKAKIATEDDPTKRKILFDEWFDWGQTQRKT